MSTAYQPRSSRLSKYPHSNALARRLEGPKYRAGDGLKLQYDIENQTNDAAP